MIPDADGKKQCFMPTAVLVNVAPLTVGHYSVFGGVKVISAFAASINFPATPRFATPLSLVFTVYDFGDDLTPYCGPGARSQRSQCVVLSYAAVLRDPDLGPAALRQRLEGHCADWREIYMPEKSVMCTESMASAVLENKPSDAVLAHEFDCIGNLVPGQAISMWCMTFMRQGGFHGRGYPTLIIMRNPEASFGIAVPPSAYRHDKTPKHVPMLGSVYYSCTCYGCLCYVCPDWE